MRMSSIYDAATNKPGLAEKNIAVAMAVCAHAAAAAVVRAGPPPGAMAIDIFPLVRLRGPALTQYSVSVRRKLSDAAAPSNGCIGELTLC